MSAVLNRGWRYEPWNLVSHLHRDLERTFARGPFGLDRGANEDAAGSEGQAREEQTITWTPAVDVRETADAFVLSADLPGVDPRAIEVTTEKGLLTIRGSRASEGAAEGKDYRRIERASGQFLRRFTLPDSANIDGVTAKSNHGVLTLTIPKRAEVQPRKIEIEAA